MSFLLDMQSVFLKDYETGLYGGISASDTPQYLDLLGFDGYSIAELIAEAQSTHFLHTSTVIYDEIITLRNLQFSRVTDKSLRLSEFATGTMFMLFPKNATGIDPTQVFNALLILLNGVTKLVHVGKCECDIAQCILGIPGAWKSIVTSELIDAGNGIMQTLAPCFNASKLMDFKADFAPFFTGTAQVQYIKNLQNIQFTENYKDKYVSYKKCTNTTQIVLRGDTCPFELLSNDNLEIQIATRLTVLGRNALPTSLDCTSEECGGVDCIRVKIPNARFRITMDTDAKQQTVNECTPSAPPATCPSGSEPFVLQIQNLKFRMEFVLDQAPDITNLPFINEEFREELQDLIIQTCTGTMRKTMNDIISQKLAPFIQQFFDAFGEAFNAASLCNPVCIDTAIRAPIDCSGEPPSLGEECDLCDQCCICLTSGDCSDICRQNCPCIVKFCEDTRTILTPLWKILFRLVLILSILFSIVSLFIIRGI